MSPVHKLEIVVDKVHLREVTRLLDDAGVSGWTMIPDVPGKGGRGERTGDELTGVMSNCYVFSACEPEKTEGLIEPLRALLRRSGGICLVTECKSVIH
ncbi:P-II family nitrogen regulator [Stratiformator vulcanicus]|uniref:Nitrogen regulatory protein P-II n=1 Tax=Stratiformator vulcanicus TaxID=2527980 RepID=A0A517R237_9PLAN|nr:transcriptional regulator [Stratiformator vulcanicus]QDT37932.1 hypothetical protein Pan189_23150 [Stratiformator vulcanicus]